MTTEFVRLPSLFEFKDTVSGKRTRYPAGWTGEVDPAVAKSARDAGVLPKENAVESAELIAARKAVTSAQAALTSAKTDAEKVKASDALKAAQDELAALEA